MGRERDCSRPFYFPCGCDLTASMSPRHGGCPGATPGSPRAACQFSMGSWQTSNALALQASLYGGGTHRLHQFHCGENEIQASLISSASVGATPTPATNFREVFRLPACKSGVF